MRDRLGIKPLYLAGVAGGLRFASSLPALVAGGGLDTSIDRVALHHYLTFHSVVPAPRTILAGVRRVEPGTLVRISASGASRVTRYWQAAFRRDPAHEGMDAEDWSLAVLEALRVAVDRRMVADVPVGVLLSGGLDSSLIVGLLAQAGQSQLQTFSVGFEPAGGRQGDEFEFSDLVAREFATDHHQIVVPGDRLLPALDRAIQAMSEPMVSHDVVAFHLLSEQVAKHVTVVQSGQGADEIFAGYDWYPPLREATGTGFDEYSGRFFDRTHAEMADVVEPDFLADRDASREFVLDYFDRPGTDAPIDRALRLDTEVMLVDDPVKRVDNMTMAWGLEGRVPFLDHELVELAAACPPELKLAQGGKGVLKDAGRRILPVEVVDREKGYFPVPALIHLEGPFLDLVESALRSPEARRRGIFRPGYVDRLLAGTQRRADAARRQQALAARRPRALAAGPRPLTGRFCASRRWVRQTHTNAPYEREAAMPDPSGNQTADVQETPLHAYGDGRDDEAQEGSRGVTGDQGQGDEASYQEGGHAGSTEFGGTPGPTDDSDAPGADAGYGAGAMDPGANDNNAPAGESNDDDAPAATDPESPARADASRPPRGAPIA